MEKKFEYKQAQQLSKIFQKHKVKYLFIGKSGAIILGYSDTTQDVDIFPEKNPENCKNIISALLELKFPLTKTQQQEILKGKDFVQIRTGPFDVNLVFAPDGIGSFNDALINSVEVEGLSVCSIDDIIKSKEAAKRTRDKESLPRLKAFRDWLLKNKKL
jgi:predicted nucleotidyltransferase